MLNKVFLLGRLCADPEERQTQGGISVTTFTLAVDRPKKDGEDKGAEFIDCVAWRQTAEFICRHFQKGKPMLIEGRLQSRRWEDKDGNRRKAVEAVVDRVEFVGGRDEAARTDRTSEEGFTEVEGLDDLPWD